VTSTCFAPTGYSLADVQLMKRVLGDKVRIKASGGVRTIDRRSRLTVPVCDARLHLYRHNSRGLEEALGGCGVKGRRLVGKSPFLRHRMTSR